MITDHPMIAWLTGFEAKRKRQLAIAPKGVIRDFLAVPLPADNTTVEQLSILSVDFETTGLHADRDKLLSVGFVAINHQQIQLKTSYHQIINAKQDLHADNVIIHHITDQQKAQGATLKHVIESLLSALAGKIMLVHFAQIEKLFLQRACLELYGFSPSFPMIDTLMIAKRQLDRRDIAYDPSKLRLSALRSKYGLPEHYAHNALNDAIATAELLLAQINNMPHANKIQLRELLL